MELFASDKHLDPPLPGLYAEEYSKVYKTSQGDDVTFRDTAEMYVSSDEEQDDYLLQTNLIG